MATKAQQHASESLIDFIESQKDILDQQMRWLRAKPEAVEEEATMSQIVAAGQRIANVTAFGTKPSEIMEFISSVRSRRG